jgi:DNA-directed RNA polymerase specialized sigma24 family protein
MDLSYVEIAKITGVSVRRIEREIVRAIVGIDRAMTERPPRTRWWKRW